ncbi:MAG: hypothetical protein E7017_03950 [Alphaproteobacteria bacterium]|nr:hypothetical protein [Alphaproteobacteria bacterium]
MLKKILIITLLFLFVCFDANAVIMQSASKALSLQNVVSSNKITAKKKEVVPAVVQPEPEPIKVKEVNMKVGVSKSITVSSEDEYLVLLKDKKNQSWRVSYDKDAVVMIANFIEDNVRKIKFMQKNSENHTIFFDLLDTNGKTVLNKALYVKGR